ncbi:MAG: ribonuclease H [Kofleriaceae bacterium]
MPWSRHRLRDADVWARVDDAGRPVADAEGRVDVVYKAAPGAKLYRAAARNLTPLGGPTVEIDAAPAEGGAGGKRGAGKSGGRGKSGGGALTAVPDGAIQVWTDGACSGNPGPAGIGVVLLDGGRREELSEYLGEGTNNIAELTAIERGLELVTDLARPVVVFTDSSYAIGLLSMGWKAKANADLVARIRATCRRFADLRFVKVAGHAGIELNERTDALATDAVRRRA